MSARRTLTAAARAAMAAGSAKAKRVRWGAPRSASKTIRIDADVADRLAAEVPARFRRDVATRGVTGAIEIYLARQEASARRKRERRSS